MRKLVVVFAITLTALLIVGCATVGKSSSNYLEAGMFVDNLKGHSFYFAMGRANLYLLGFIPLRAADTAVSIQVEKTTGKVVRIVTLQPAGRAIVAANYSSNVYVYGDRQYKIDDLIGGISIIDINFTETWAEAIEATMKLAAR